MVETKVLGKLALSTSSIIAHDYLKSIESPAGNTTKRRGMCLVGERTRQPGLRRTHRGANNSNVVPLFYQWQCDIHNYLMWNIERMAFTSHCTMLWMDTSSLWSSSALSSSLASGSAGVSGVSGSGIAARF